MADHETSITLEIACDLLRRAEQERDQLRADVDRLNQMLRETGYGQGSIDAYVAQCEEVDRLRDLLREVRDPANRVNLPAMLAGLIDDALGTIDQEP